MTSNIKIISIDGNIGSGKTTLMHNLREKYADNYKIVFLKEPVDEWEKIVDKDGVTMLQKFYSNQEKYSFSFQMMAYISRLKILRDAVKRIQEQGILKAIIFTERSLYTDKYIFAKMLFDQGKIEDVCYSIYRNWFDEFAKDYPISGSVYVNTDPSICYERIHKRERQGEEVIPLSYLVDCHNYHTEFIEKEMGCVDNIYSIQLDGNNDIYDNPTILEDWLNKIDVMTCKI
uniref:Deoxynucleoside kinase domain-containing protein n=1 Tax=viral metagenome TaxID=1070528 RepID=A0A6C0ITK2_9ZZZZ